MYEEEGHDVNFTGEHAEKHQFVLDLKANWAQKAHEMAKACASHLDELYAEQTDGAVQVCVYIYAYQLTQS